MNAHEEMNEERRLDEALAALRREELGVQTPARVEDALMRAWDTSGRQKAAPGWRTLTPAAALAAGLVLAVALGRLGIELREVGLTPRDADGTTLLLVGEPILEGEPVRVVRMRMPVSTLLDLGMRSTSGHGAGEVDVDVVVGEDGVARGIRF